MPYVPHGFTFADALARNEDVYEVEVTAWGSRTLGNSPPTIIAAPNFQFPPPGERGLPSSVAVVAIGPRSTVDRAWLSWDRQKLLNVPPADVPNPNAVISPTRIITVGAPLLTPQMARPGTLTSKQSLFEAMQLGEAYVFPFGLPQPFPNAIDASANNNLEGTYGTTTAVPLEFLNRFGAVVPFYDLDLAPPEFPFLHLLLYPKVPTFGPATVRAPMLRSGRQGITDTNVRIATLPIYGRKHVRVQLVSATFGGLAPQICDFKLGLLRNVNESIWSPGLVNNTPVFEANGGDALATPINTPVQFTIDNPGADYLTIYVTNTGLAPCEVIWTMVAED